MDKSYVCLDFPLGPPPLSCSYCDPSTVPVHISLFDPVFPAQSIVIARCSLFRFNSHPIVRISAVRLPFFVFHPYTCAPSHLSPLSLSDRFISYLFCRPPPLSLLFPSRFTLACSFRSRTESINSLIFLTLFTTLFLASTYMSDPTHPPQILPSHSFSPNILMCPISHPFPLLLWVLVPPLRPRSLTSTRAH